MSAQKRSASMECSHSLLSDDNQSSRSSSSSTSTDGDLHPEMSPDPVTRDGKDSSDIPPGIAPPNSHDVLLGRGRPSKNFSGNRRMLNIVSKFKEEYNARPRDQKRAFVETVLDVVLKDGTKFLRLVKGEGDGAAAAASAAPRWKEVDRKAAAEKVWHVLRCKDRPRRRRGKELYKGEAGTVPSTPTRSTTTLGGEAPSQQQPHAWPPVGGNATSTSEFRASANASSSTPMPSTTSIMSRVGALLGDIQQHLTDAVSSTNLLASMIATTTTTTTSTAASPSVLFERPLPHTVPFDPPSARWQPHNNTYGSFLDQVLLSQQQQQQVHSDISLRQQQGSSSTQSHLFSNLGAFPPPFSNPSLGGILSAPLSLSSAPTHQQQQLHQLLQQHQQQQQTSERDQILAQAARFLIQATKEQPAGPRRPFP